ncbi:MAG TPA: hypothetical protein VHP58_05855 [Alphaproteobacteria bacterium]|nr:hypothetical protein [Alphaproteobacteria bacterium]
MHLNILQKTGFGLLWCVEKNVQKVLELRRPALRLAGGIVAVIAFIGVCFIAADYVALNGLATRINHASIGGTIR